MSDEITSGRIPNVSLAERAWRIRRYAVRMGEVQGQGYVGQALGIADVLAVSYFHALRYQPDDPHWEGRDRFLLSIGQLTVRKLSLTSRKSGTKVRCWKSQARANTGRWRRVL